MEYDGHDIVFAQTGTGWSAYPEGLPGVGATGESREEVERLIREAIDIHKNGIESVTPQKFALYFRIDEVLGNGGSITPVYDPPSERSLSWSSAESPPESLGQPSTTQIVEFNVTR